MPTYDHSANPFTRGFNDLRIQRLLAILYDADAPLCYLPPHPAQQHLSDSELERHRCLFNAQYALVESADTVLPADQECYSGQGMVVQVIHGIYAYDQSPPILIGDQYSQSLAEQRLQQLSFTTGHYSRCWEISSAHLPDSTWSDLLSILLDDWPKGLLFETFTLPDSCALGFKLIGTPWTNSNLTHLCGDDADKLRRQQLKAGLPIPLVEVLHLAANADVRILIFDPDAACLDGLPTYDSPA